MISVTGIPCRLQLSWNLGQSEQRICSAHDVDLESGISEKLSQIGGVIFLKVVHAIGHSSRPRFRVCAKKEETTGPQYAFEFKKCVNVGAVERQMLQHVQRNYQICD
jgi:hypothetical protein